ncbi:MAG: hypothetical protein ABWZ40_10390 [Caulobacterales bacterium]
MFWLDLYKYGKFVLRKEVQEDSFDDAIETAEREIKGLHCTSGRLVNIDDNRIAWRGYSQSVPY